MNESMINVVVNVTMYIGGTAFLVHAFGLDIGLGISLLVRFHKSYDRS